MAPYPVIQRGYGGAKFSDLAVFIDRLVRPHRFDAVVIFVGNDISGNKDDKSPAEVLRLIQIIVGKIREHNDAAPIFLIAVTPTSSRFAAWEKIKQLNSAIDGYCQKTDGVHYIDTVDRYLDEAGKPIDSYFVADKLHQNQAGYEVWSEIIKGALRQVLAEPR
jgi:lysophospholipase L1-like esterase